MYIFEASGFQMLRALVTFRFPPDVEGSWGCSLGVTRVLLCGKTVRHQRGPPLSDLLSVDWTPLGKDLGCYEAPRSLWAEDTPFFFFLTELLTLLVLSLSFL